ncbi:YhfC family intramembrane metalloprotease [Candidatus Saccharibacteria bacterium]|nr:YhfC family intramembrane metalloprotease [Candidatus Saccharibacteria bacterium]
MKSKITITPYIRNIILALPLYILSIVPFIALAIVLDIEIDTGYVLLGALGWWLALLLRLPLILYSKTKKLDFNVSNKLIIGASGPTEEITRLVLLATIGITTGNAYSVGIGWASIEVIYGLVQIIGMGILQQKNDKEAKEAKSLMKQMGMEKSLEPSTPFWGALERVSAGAIHIGLSLMLVLSPLIVLITIPLHSFVNFSVVRMNKQSIIKSQLSILLLGIIILLTGILIS